LQHASRVLPVSERPPSPVGYPAPHQEHREAQVCALEEKAERLAAEVEAMAEELARLRENTWLEDRLNGAAVPDKKEQRKRQKALQRTARLAQDVHKGIAAHDTDMRHLLVVIQSYDATWNALPPGWRVLTGRKMVSEYNARKGSVEAPDER